LKQTELPAIRFYDLRHTYAALNIPDGLDLFTLSRRMGHSSITATADREMTLYETGLHPEFHPGVGNAERGAPSIDGLPRPIVVPPARLERTTRGLGNRCSIHLSYGGKLTS